jgi:two-component system nitrate/nitrite response regulator NarL
VKYDNCGSHAPVTSPSVLIVSDVLLYREGVASGLSRSGVLIVASTANCDEALRAITDLGPDAVLLDVSSPEALQAARQIRLAAPGILIIGFGIMGGESRELACAEAGLVGFVGHDGTIDELVATVQSAFRGEVRCSPRLAALLCHRITTLYEGRTDLPVRLTRREREISCLITDGLSNKEIACELKLGPATVKNHVHNILEKLKVTRRAAVSARLRLTIPPGVHQQGGPVEAAVHRDGDTRA